MTCPACLSALPTDARFCGVCGFRLAPIPVDAPTGGALATGAAPQDAAEERAPRPRRTTADRRAAEGSGIPQRRYPRFPLKVEVTFASEHNFYTGLVQNIGSGGLFVATTQLLPLGARLDVEFSLPGWDPSCLASCEVTWLRDREAVHGGADGVPGMGLRFVEVAPEVAAAVDRFIRHREPIFFDEL